MNRCIVFIASLLLGFSSIVSAMGQAAARPVPQNGQAQPHIRAPQDNRLGANAQRAVRGGRNNVPAARVLRAGFRAFIPSKGTVTSGLFSAGAHTALSCLTNSKSQIFGMNSQFTLFNYLFYAYNAFNDGCYVTDGNRHCYYAREPERYDMLFQKIAEREQQDEDEGGDAADDGEPREQVGWSFVHAGMSMAALVGSALLFSKLVAVAGSVGALHRVGSLLFNLSARPGAVGLATLFGLNAAAVFGSMATKYWLEKLFINPVVRPLLIRLSCKLRGVPFNPIRRRVPVH